MPNGKRHHRISLSEALSAHRRALTLGGRPGIPNIGMVESAIARPYSGYYRPISKKTAALIQSVATNHGFADGNKRTTVILMHTLLKKSGYTLVSLPNEILEDAVKDIVLRVVQHQITFDELASWLRGRIRRA